MKLLKKIIKYIGIIFLLLILVGAFYIYTSGSELPANTDDIIENVCTNPLPELIKGQSGFANAQGVNIWYENIMPQDTPKGVVLLIMGISNDALGWPPQFIQSFINSGYQVIRYDHRGTGLSDWLDNWNAENPYTLTDMANDGIAILDKLGIQKANIIGVSMGGMIAQELAIHHSDRVASLTSIMSSGNVFDDKLPPISSAVAYDLIKVAIKYSVIGTERNMIKLHLASRMILMGTANHNLNTKAIAEQVLYNIRQRKGYNANVSKQHQSAVTQSGSRYEELKNLTMPTLIIHGESDPFIPIEHGKRCAALIPSADTLWIENMGHDIPNVFIPRITEKVMENFNRTILKD